MKILFGIFLTWIPCLILADSEKITRVELGAVVTALKHLGMTKPHFVCRKDESIYHLRRLFYEVGVPLRVSRYVSPFKTTSADNLVFCPDHDITHSVVLSNMSLADSLSRPWLILERGLFFKGGDHLHIQLQHQVYFFHLDTLSITEIYTINSVLVRNQIGQIVVLNSEKASLLYHKETQDSFVKRRSNFRGLSLRAMVENDGLNVKINPYFKEDKNGWVLDKQGHPIKQIESSNVAGLYVDVLHILQQDMNFTTELFMRKDGGFGYPVNGTWVGMIANLLYNDADLILAGVTINVARRQVVDYLHRITTIKGGIFIGRKGLEEHAWLSFLYPLRTDVWVFLLFYTIVLLGIVKSLQILHRRRDFWNRTALEIIEDTVGDFWMLGASYFGRRANTTNLTESESLGIVFFFAFFSGTVVFMVYRSSLTAELAVKRDSPPFKTLDDLYKSSYRVTTHGYTKAFVRMQAASSSPAAAKLYQILSQYDDEDGGKSLIFSTAQEAIEDIIDVPGHAFLSTIETMYEHPEYKCDIICPWIDDRALQRSMAFQKKSPYVKFMNFKLLERFEHGLLSILHRRYYELDIECVLETKFSLSIFKSISLFGVVMATGVIGSLLIFFGEGLWYSCSRALNAPASVSKSMLSHNSYEDELKGFMSKWNIGETHDFLSDLDWLHQLRKRKTYSTQLD